MDIVCEWLNGDAVQCLNRLVRMEALYFWSTSPEIRQARSRSFVGAGKPALGAAVPNCDTTWHDITYYA